MGGASFYENKKANLGAPLPLGAPLAFDLAPLLTPWGSTGSSSGAPACSMGHRTHGLHSSPVGYLGPPLSLEPPKLLIRSACLLLAPFSLDQEPQIAPRALWYPKEPHWLLGAPRALLTDEAFWGHETYMHDTFRAPWATFYFRGSS